MARSSLIDPLEGSLGYQMRRAVFATMAPLVDAFAALELKPTEAIILRLVDANPGCNQSEIGRSLGVQRTNMVPIITGLVDRGLVRRDQADGRTHALHLTPEGERLHARVIDVSEAHDRAIFGDVPPQLRQELVALCRTVRERALDDRVGAGDPAEHRSAPLQRTGEGLAVD
jgi:DNA-binding MarR family transcriptional regulator